MRYTALPEGWAKSVLGVTRRGAIKCNILHIRRGGSRKHNKTENFHPFE